jgi:hypothetical protein
MPVQPQTSRELDRAGGKLHGSGARLLLLGGVLFAIGLVLVLVGDGNWDAAGLTAWGFSTAATLAGLALSLSGGVAKRSASGKPFA